MIKPTSLLSFTSIIVGVMSFPNPHIANGQAVKVDGTWKISIPAARVNATLDLIQKDGTLSGTFRGPRGEAPINGTISSANKISFSAKGQAGISEFNGTVTGNSMSGTANVPRLGQIEWSATK